MEWLSQGVEALLEIERRECDVLVVGSGYGGAVAALRLAEHGVENVWLLERGRERLPGEFPHDWAHVVGDIRIDPHGQPKTIGKPDALIDLRVGRDVAAVLGNALGGGSQVNANVAIEADRRVFDREPWPRVFRDNAALLDRHYERARRMLGAAPHPDPLPAKSRVLGELAPHVGAYLNREWAGGAPQEPVRLERPCIAVNFTVKGRNDYGVPQQPCVGCGDCVTGCNYGAKNTLTTNYLPAAVRAGARLFTGATVLSIYRHKDRRWRVRFRRTADEKDPEVQPATIAAATVILAAGTLGSTEILLRSARRQEGLTLSPQVGRSFSCNGDLIAAGYDLAMRCESIGGVHDGRPRADAPGPTITGMIDLRRAMHPARGLVLQDAVIPGPLAQVFGEVVTLASTPVQMLEERFCGDLAALNSDPLAVSKERLQRTHVYLAMGEDAAAGAIMLDDHAIEEADRARVWVHWPGAGRQRIYGAEEELLRQCARLGGIYLNNPASKPFSDAMARILTGPEPRGPAITVHPLGGCPMGDDAQHGAVDHAGRVYDGFSATSVHAGLYVIDGSTIPTAIGANPFLTIAALAERAVELLIAERFPLAGARREIELGAMPRPTSPAVREDQRVGFRFSERMDGELAGRLPFLDGVKRSAVRLEIEFEVPEVDAWLEDPEHRVAQAGGTVRFGEGAVARTFDVAGDLALLVREPAPRWRRRLRALWHWLRLRGLKEIWRAFAERKPLDLVLLKLLWRIAPHIGERRFMDYNLEFTAAGQRYGLFGRKTIEYSGRSNLWRSLCDLKVDLRPLHGRNCASGMLSLDFVDLVRNRIPQILRQPDAPTGLLALARAALWVVRVMFQAHFWSFDAPDYERAEKPRRRYPGPLADRAGAGLMQPEQHWIAPGILLSRYRGAALKPGLAPVLLFHGFAHSGLVFASDTIEENLVQYLCKQGFEAWVVELRTSIALESSWRQWNFDQIAAQDVPAAVDYVHRLTLPPGRDPAQHRVKVVAHCMGSAVFSMAALKGALGSKVEAAVLMQVAPLLRGSRSNELRANQAAFMRDALRIDHVNAAVDDSADWQDVVADRIAMTYPLPEEEAPWHRFRPCEKRTDLANCNRITMLMGRQWVHANLAAATHRKLGELLANANLTTFMQIAHFIELGRLVDSEGANVYVLGENIVQHMNFPILFVHGENTDVFHPETTARSLEMFRRINSTVFYDRKLIPGYGHFDCLVGKNACRDVFPFLGEFLGRPAYQKQALAAVPPPQAKPPLLGPVVGWTRLEQDPRGADGYPGQVPVVRVWIKVDDTDVHPAQWVFAAVCRGRGPHLDWPSIEYMRMLPVLTLCREKIAVADLALPDDAHDYSILFASAHQPASCAGQAVPLGLACSLGQQNDPASTVLDELIAASPGEVDKKLVTQLFSSVPQSGHQVLVAELQRLGRTLLEQWGAALREGSGAFLSQGLLQRVLHRQQEIAVLFGSCRYPGSPFERERSDAIFAHVLGQIEASAAPPPGAFLMVGDQIYPDATAELFDVAAPRERFVNRYDQALGSPGLRAVMRRVPTFMAADDHEIANDWEKWTPGKEAANARVKAGDLLMWAKRSFRCHQWAVSPRTGAAGPLSMNDEDGSWDRDRFWYRFDSGGFGFFVMDTRFERRAVERGQVFEGDIVSPEQMRELRAWLTEQQAKRGAQPKFVACGSVVTPFRRDNTAHDAYRQRDDSWYRYKEQLDQLVRHIATGPIENVVFLCGDFHVSLATEMRYAIDGAPVADLRSWCIVSSPFYAPIPFVNGRRDDYVQDSIAENATHVAGNVSMDFSVLDAFEDDNFARVHAFSEGGRWKLRVQFFDRAGRKAVERVL